MLSVVCPPVPDHAFTSSIEPLLRVFVKVQTTTSLSPTKTELPAPGT